MKQTEIWCPNGILKETNKFRKNSKIRQFSENSPLFKIERNGLKFGTQMGIVGKNYKIHQFFYNSPDSNAFISKTIRDRGKRTEIWYPKAILKKMYDFEKNSPIFRKISSI